MPLQHPDWRSMYFRSIAHSVSDTGTDCAGILSWLFYERMTTHSPISALRQFPGKRQADRLTTAT